MGSTWKKSEATASGNPDGRYGFLDLEISRSGTVHEIGALLEGRTFSRRCRGGTKEALQRLDAFLAPASVLVGHNLMGHDLVALRSLQPGLALLSKPVIDTLYLSPLAFPANPYHRLVKDYKLVRDAVNDPVADARLAARLFADQDEVFRRLGKDEPLLPAFFAFCFRGNPDFGGICSYLEGFGHTIDNAAAAAGAFSALTKARICNRALADYMAAWLDDDATRTALPYCLAWLRVAGTNSVLPPWVLRRFPGVSSILRKLRDIPCREPDCAYCRQTHDPELQLKKFFGFPSFRPVPTGEDGHSLQQSIVEHAMGDRPLLAILPTGGGKSLCYQLPALVRYQRRGLLTIVISPLQALMKDQVDNLRSRTGTPAAVALYGMLTPPRRGEVLRMIRMGDAGILYVSPEQLRNRSFRGAIREREIGCWVFDEAHCLSKWGHDFRTDYLYAARFIREFSAGQQRPVPPVQCFTATARQEVRDEILDHFRRELDQELTLFSSSVERDNLRFEVQEVSAAAKFSRVGELLEERLTSGAAIVYCATRRQCERLAEFLEEKGFAAAAFHAGLEAPLKQHIQDNFLNGAIRVICATNAFGMGIDKEDVRLVIHADIPGSLENYLQEAGRAGRDRLDADCVLLFDDQDVETQFAMTSLSRLSRADIAQILRGLRSARRNSEGNVVLTPHELLRSDRVETSFDQDDRDAATKVYTAVSWLERAGFVERNENLTRVFQGRPRVRSMAEAAEKIRTLKLGPGMQQRWLTILEILMNAGSDESFSADQLAEMLPPLPGEEADRSGSMVLRTLNDMATAGLIKKSMILSAFVRHKVSAHSRLLLKRVCELERGMLDLMQEQAPEADSGQWQNLGLRRLNQGLLDRGFTNTNPESLRSLLVSLSRDGRGMAGKQGSIDFRQFSRDTYRVRLQRDWPSLRKTARLRENVAFRLLHTIMAKIPRETPASAQLQVEFSAEELEAGLKGDLLLRSELSDPAAAMERGLMFLHEQRVITLQQGLAVFRQAMTVRVLPEKRRYTKGDFAPLSHHYGERIFQVHVMNEYARRGAEKIAQALKLILGYFTMDRPEFVRRFFPGREDILERATSHESYLKIVESLRNPQQESLVTAPENDNILVLAGPGAGKTRVVVHRCAYLLRVLRVPAAAILVLCFNRSSVAQLRRRLRKLAGRDGYGVAVHTYHGLALRLTGRSPLAVADEEGGEERCLKEAMREAVELLRGRRQIPGLEPDGYRERLLSGRRHILVDEYQDIDREQYELISALSGRTLEADQHRLTIMAVGDDDQNIYAFRGSGVEFIRRFREDYRAQVRYLVENYRSTAHIISAANRVIDRAGERMKGDHPIRVNRARRHEDPGGVRARLDPFGRGRVRCIRAATMAEQAAAVLNELQRLLRPGGEERVTPRQCAVLARHWRTLSLVRELCTRAHPPIPVDLVLESRGLPPLHRIREFACFIDLLRQRENSLVSATQLRMLARRLRGKNDNRWWRRLCRLLSEWYQEVGDGELPLPMFLEYLFETLREQRREHLRDDALFLGTVHAAKGLEFDHVFIMDDGWNRAAGRSHLEEERRLYYVAMTRARHTLTLLEAAAAPNPFSPALAGDFLLRTEYAGSRRSIPVLRRSTLLTLKDLDLGYAGRRAPENRIHARLAALQPGSPLTLDRRGGKTLLLADTGPVAALSRKGAARLQGLRADPGVRVIAVFRRYRRDGDPAYQHLCRCDHWEVPLVEISR